MSCLSGAEINTLFHRTCFADCLQEISSLDSELINLDSQIRMQLESVEAKDAKLKEIRHQIEQVLLFHFAGFDSF